jgi:hypothetical protein
MPTVPKPHATFANPAVEAVFASYPRAARTRLLQLRGLILDVATTTTGVGELEETLRWSEPSYLTTRSRSGSMLRIHWKPADGEHCCIYVHCQTNLVATFRALYPTELVYVGNRAVLVPLRGSFPADVLRHCIALALTYRSTRKARVRAAT